MVPRTFCLRNPVAWRCREQPTQSRPLRRSLASCSPGATRTKATGYDFLPGRQSPETGVHTCFGAMHWCRPTPARSSASRAARELRPPEFCQLGPGSSMGHPQRAHVRRWRPSRRENLINDVTSLRSSIECSVVQLILTPCLQSRGSIGDRDLWLSTRSPAGCGALLCRCRHDRGQRASGRCGRHPWRRTFSRRGGACQCPWGRHADAARRPSPPARSLPPPPMMPVTRCAAPSCRGSARCRLASGRRRLSCRLPARDTARNAAPRGRTARYGSRSTCPAGLAPRAPGVAGHRL